MIVLNPALRGVKSDTEVVSSTLKMLEDIWKKGERDG